MFQMDDEWQNATALGPGPRLERGPNDRRSPVLLQRCAACRNAVAITLHCIRETDGGPWSRCAQRGHERMRSPLVRGNDVAAAVIGHGGRAPNDRGRRAPFFFHVERSSAVTSLPPTVVGGRPGATARDPVDRCTGRPGQRAAYPTWVRSPRVRGAPARATAASRFRRTVSRVKRSFRAAPCSMR